MNALHSMLAATTSGRGKELVTQGVPDRNGMVNSRTLWHDSWGSETHRCFQFQWNSNEKLEDKHWVKPMRQESTTSLEDGS